MRWLSATITLVIASLVGSAAAAASLSPIDYHARVLPNGLKVYTVLDTARPKVSVQLWYGAGARNDPAGRSGLAHLFEHLMFKGRGEVPPGYLDQLTEAAGGESNASTTRDFTEFHDAVPPSQLERVLWAEAARMARLEITQADLDRERTVVEREIIEAAVDEPQDPALAWDMPAAKLDLPVGVDTPLGSMTDLRRVSLGDVQTFHDLYYRPDNAALVVAGAFDPAQLDRWVNRYFAPIPRPQTPLASAERQPVLPKESCRRRRAHDMALVLGFPAPPAASGDAPALYVINALLTGADDGLAFTRLVDRDLASDVFSEADLRPRSGIFYVGGVPPTKGSSGRLERALRATLARLRDRPPDAKALTAAKNQLLVDALTSRETIDGLAGEIGRAAIVQGDAAIVNTDPAALQRVTAQDVQRVARRYLGDHRAVTLWLRSTGRARAAGDAAPRPPSAGQYAAPRTAAASPGPPEPPSASHPASAVLAPRLFERMLPGGLRVVVAPSGRLPLATATLVTAGGASLDGPDAAGLTKLSADMSLFGCGPTVREASAAFEHLGLTASAEVDADTSRLSLTGLSASLPEGLRLLARCVQAPTPAGARFRRLSRELRDERGDPAGDVDLVADAAFERLRSDHAACDHRGPVARQVRGGARAQVSSRRRALFQPGGAVLVLTGDVDPAAEFRRAEALFGGWRVRSDGPQPPARSAGPPGKGPLVVDAPGYPLALVAIGAPIPGHGEPAHLAFELADSALGGSFTSRLSQSLRARRGLTYDVSSWIEWRRGAGLFTARTEVDPSVAPQVATLMLSEVRALGRTGPTEGELAKQKALVAAQLADAAETTADLADLLAKQAARCEPLGGAFDDARRLAAINVSQVRTAASRLADSDNARVVIVADVRRLPGSFVRQLPQGSLVPVDDLLRATD